MDYDSLAKQIKALKLHLDGHDAQLNQIYWIKKWKRKNEVTENRLALKLKDKLKKSTTKWNAEAGVNWMS